MTISYLKFFNPVVLGTGATTLLTVAATPTTNLLRGGRVRLTNTTSAAVAGTLYAVPSGGSAAVGNCFCAAKVIAGNDYLDIDVPILAAGDTLQGLAGAGSSLTAHMIAGSMFA